MQTKIIKIDSTNIDSEKIKEAASLIDDGGLVAFPTETVYGIACRVRNDTLSKLNGVKGRDPSKYYTLHISDKSEISKYVPTINLRAKKIIDKAWPGPLTLVFELEFKDIDKQKSILEKEFFKNLYKNNSIGIRCPDNAIASMLLHEINDPVIAPSANISGKQPAVNPEEVLSQLSGKIDLLIDAGPSKYKESSSVFWG